MLYIVQYSGPFGFIKPWTAIRDSETFSQQFLTPSIIEGIEKKLFPELLSHKGIAGRIVRHRLRSMGIDKQQEQIQPRAIQQKYNKTTQTVSFSRPRSILTRGILLSPIVFLAFSEREYAEKANTQHICLCRNEDVLLPDWQIKECSEEEFDNPENEVYHGFELLFGKSEDSFLVGYNRYVQKDNKQEQMYGRLHIVGNPIYKDTEVYE